MSSTILVVIALIGIGLAWLAFFRFSQDSREFLVLITLTVLIIVLMIVGAVIPNPTSTAQTASIVLTPAGSSTPETTTPESTIVATEPVAASTATATTAPTVAATATTTPTIAATVAPTLSATTAPPTPTTAPATATPTTTSIVTTVLSSAANIRNAPSPESTIVGSVRQGDQLIIIAATGDWYLVRLGVERAADSTLTTGQGWIAKPLVITPLQTVPTITP